MDCYPGVIKLYPTGPGEVLEMARKLIGVQNLAIRLAKSALTGTTESLSPTKVSEVFGMSRNGAQKKIENASVKEML